MKAETGKYGDYGEIITIEDFLMDTSEPVDDLSEVVEEYEEDVYDKEEVPTKCVSTNPALPNQLRHLVHRF